MVNFFVSRPENCFPFTFNSLYLASFLSLNDNQEYLDSSLFTRSKQAHGAAYNISIIVSTECKEKYVDFI